MLTALLGIIDRLIELVKVRQTQRSNFFQKIVEPSFAELLMVHQDYISMFTEVLNMLSSQSETEERVQREKALQMLKQRRTTLEPLREKLRALERVTESERDQIDKDAYAFLHALADYLFIGVNSDERWTPKRTTIATDLISVLQRDGSTQGRERCAEILNSLRQRWSFLCEAYAALRVAVARAAL
ncbi:MAG TPA: hypothetical protein VKV30_17135 [Candidatus Angelobacter sp.]|nr:hypothetical protein [Candidatus Angelobacter sp.]